MSSFVTELKNSIVILLLSVHLFAVTEAHQLLKLPMVFHHYVDHQQEDPQMSFMSYLVLHYLQHDSHEHDNGAHGNMPFKNTSTDCFAMLTFNGFTAPLWTMIKRPVYFVKNYSYPSSEVFTHTDYLNQIWHPPQA